MATSPQDNSVAVRYVDTTTAYDLWSEVYDTDGNFLQALDTIEMKRLLPQMLAEIKATPPWRIVDLGCGTGRNTSALLSLPDTHVVALDASSKMLEGARSRFRLDSQREANHAEPHLEIFDLLQSSSPPNIAVQVDAVVSTLVIEHIPAKVFFRHVSQMLKSDGVLLLTNMHSDMGNISQAGFVDPKTGDKVRPKSYAHTTTDIETEARNYGLKLIRQIEERSVSEALTEQLGSRPRNGLELRCGSEGFSGRRVDQSIFCSDAILAR